MWNFENSPCEQKMWEDKQQWFALMLFLAALLPADAGTAETVWRKRQWILLFDDLVTMALTTGILFIWVYFLGQWLCPRVVVFFFQLTRCLLYKEEARCQATFFTLFHSSIIPTLTDWHSEFMSTAFTYHVFHASAADFVFPV